jgi:hypothetical protein
MSDSTQAAQRIKTTLEQGNYRRGTKQRPVRRRFGHTQSGQLATLQAGDVAQACAAVAEADRTQVIRDLAAGTAQVPADTEVRVEADDAWHIVDLLAA